MCKLVLHKYNDNIFLHNFERGVGGLGGGKKVYTGTEPNSILLTSICLILASFPFTYDIEA